MDTDVRSSVTDISVDVGVVGNRAGMETASADERLSVNERAPPGRASDYRYYRYGDTFADLSPNDIQTICEVKRFLECYEGDRDFRKAVKSGEFTEQQRQMLKDIGVSFEPEVMELLWSRPDLLERFHLLVARHEKFEDVPSDVHAALAPFPELRLWLAWRHCVDRVSMIQKLLVSSKSSLSPEYTAWRNRRVMAVRNELGSFGWSLDHPCYAVEMGVGCSVQCAFCAFDADKLQTVFDISRPENRELVRGVAAGMANILGGWTTGHGMLYWSTEPHDNPHYVRLLEFWYRLTGAMLCTATARADVDWARDLIEFYGKGPVQWPRISVLSRGMMRRLHKAFTPLEMRDTALLMQQKDSVRVKVPGGRERMLKQLVEADDLRKVDFENLPEGFEPPQGSIACISGFLINMVNRTIKLISPCYTTMEHRYGYRIFDEATFEGPEDFEIALQRIVKRSMVVRPYPEMPMRWRDDLKVVLQPDGFTLLSPTTKRDFRKGDLHRCTAELIGRGDLSYEQVFDALADEPQIGPMTAMVMLDSLFDGGYLCELEIARDHRLRQESVGEVIS